MSTVDELSLSFLKEATSKVRSFIEQGGYRRLVRKYHQQKATRLTMCRIAGRSYRVHKRLHKLNTNQILSHVSQAPFNDWAQGGVYTTRGYTWF